MKSLNFRTELTEEMVLPCSAVKQTGEGDGVLVVKTDKGFRRDLFTGKDSDFDALEVALASNELVDIRVAPDSINDADGHPEFLGLA